MDDKEMNRILHEVSDMAMDMVVDSMVGELTTNIIGAIEGACKDCLDLDKRKLMMYSKIIEKLQEQVDKSCGEIKVEN